jgi:hypothetical protein
MTFTQSAVAVAAVLILWCVIGLGYAGVELTLLWKGLPTISQRVWLAPWKGVPIVAWAFSLPIFLTLHFWFNFLRPKGY